MSPTKNSNPQLPNIFIKSTRLSAPLEDLNSSLAQSAGELWPSAKMAKVTLQDLIFYPNIVFLSRTFKPEMLDGKSKTLKDWNHILVSTKT